MLVLASMASMTESRHDRPRDAGDHHDGRDGAGRARPDGSSSDGEAGRAGRERVEHDPGDHARGHLVAGGGGVEAVVGPEALVEVAVGDVDEGDAAARADGGGGLDLNIGPLAQDGAQGRHERGAAVELA